jgi:hypothetical protein
MDALEEAKAAFEAYESGGLDALTLPSGEKVRWDLWLHIFRDHPDAFYLVAMGQHEWLITKSKEAYHSIPQTNRQAVVDLSALTAITYLGHYNWTEECGEDCREVYGRIFSDAAKAWLDAYASEPLFRKFLKDCSSRYGVPIPI